MRSNVQRTVKVRLELERNDILRWLSDEVAHEHKGPGWNPKVYVRVPGGDNWIDRNLEDPTIYVEWVREEQVEE